MECSSAVKTIEKFPKNIKHLKVNLLRKIHFDCSYIIPRCFIIVKSIFLHGSVLHLCFFFARARVLTIISPDGDKSVEGLNVFLFPHRTDEIEFNTWGSWFNPVILFIPLQEVQAEAAAREGERRFGFDNYTAPLGQIYVSVFFSFVFF